MKKIIALLLAMSMCFALVACGETDKPVDDTNKPTVENTDPDPAPQPENQPTDTPTEQPSEQPSEQPDDPEITLAATLLNDFNAKVGTMTAEELANALVTNEAIQFTGGAVPVEPGFLTGFNNEITGFKTGVMFAPMIGTIPFVGYIFEMEDGADVAAFEETLKTQANLRWNICTAADEMIVQSVDNTVFFIMAPYNMESDAPVDDGGMALDGEDPVDGEATTEGESPVEDQVPAADPNAEDPSETETHADDGATVPAEGEVNAPVEGETTTPAETDTTTAPAA